MSFKSRLAFEWLDGELMTDLDRFLALPKAERDYFFSSLGYYAYTLCEIADSQRRIPFYVGKGKGARCLSHIDDAKNVEKHGRVEQLQAARRLGIDIIAHGLDEKTAFIVESVCIDLLNVENLTNAVRGRGENTKRMPINELASLFNDKPVTIESQHRGVAFLLEKSFKSNFGDLELLEITRGVWAHKQSDDIKYAYATFRGVIKEVYEIFSWVPAGTQQYFTRTISEEAIASRYEFVGKKASEAVRNLYVGKVINKKRSFALPYVKVGFDV